MTQIKVLRNTWIGGRRVSTNEVLEITDRCVLSTLGGLKALGFIEFVPDGAESKPQPKAVAGPKPPKAAATVKTVSNKVPFKFARKK